MPPRRPLVLVAAVARNGVIGAGAAMPWRLPGDLARFRRITMGHPLLMGRTTFETIGRPLPGRLTTVLSGRADYAPAGVAVAPTLQAALESADRQADRLGAAAIMVVGGGEVYAATIGLAQKLLITEVEAWPDGDVLFPAIDPVQWERTAVQDAAQGPDDAFRHRFVCWNRRESSTM